MPKQQFTCFPKLPPEIRLKIWELLIKPRIVHPKWVRRNAAIPGAITLHSKEICELESGGVPVVLHICKESRAEALKRGYTLICDQLFTTRRSNFMYFNFAIDTLYIQQSSTPLLEWFPDGIRGGSCGVLRRELRHIRFHHKVLSTSRQYYWEKKLIDVLLAHSSLETVTVVVDDMLPKNPAHCEFVQPKTLSSEEVIAKPKEARRQYCTEAFKTETLANVDEEFDKIKQRVPGLKRPSLRAMSLIKYRRLEWLG